MTSRETFGTSSRRAAIRTVGVMIPHVLAFALAAADTTSPPPDAVAPRPPRVAVRGLGGPIVGVTQLGSGAALLTGGRGGVVLDRWLMVGLQTEGTPLLDGFQASLPGGRKMAYWQVGPMVEASPFDRSIVHPRFGMELGGAWIGTDGATGKESTFAVVFEPTATLEATLTRFLRVGATAGYRFAIPTSRLVSFGEASGLVAGLSLQIGFVD